MINGRITAGQMEWLEARAAELGGNLSATLRQVISDARLLEAAREDYRQLRREHPDFQIPRHDDDGSSRVVEAVLGFKMSDPDDLELRTQEDAP